MTAPQDPFSTPPQGGAGDTPGYGTPGYGTPGAQPAGPPAGYGAPAYGQQPGGFGGHVSPKNGFGVAALVLGILSLPAAFTVVFGVLLGLLAVIFGFLGRGRVKKGTANNGGVATTGLVLGIVGLVLSIVFAVAVGSILSRGDFGSLTECLEQAGDDQAAIDECSAEFEDSVSG